MREWQSVRSVVDQVEDCDSVSNGRKQTGAILGVDEVAFPVDRPEQVGELSNMG